eukprot:TRINITY_DN7428_c0_g1_i1.p2 TRINITY_DN7428_c0_g1~~TRINITY_DN7428_c0_g1_i1.p2  ORF type:complete len:57 (+),score=0.51 TRINITY_DN7428_c0_g1_i1:61-231(+)
MRKLTTRGPLIALYISPKNTFLKTNSSNIGPTIEIKIMNTGICFAITIKRSVFGLF